MELRSYQEEAVEAVRGAWEEGVRDPAVEIFCGLGKSLIMKTLLQELGGIRLVVMPSLSLVNQFCHDYLDRDTYLPFCSLGECDDVMRATTQEEQVAAFLEGEPDGILVVTYKSLAKLLGFLEGREIEGALFDESHHIAETQYNFIKELQIKVAYFSATPPKNLGQTVFEFSYADALNYVDPDGESRPWSRDFRVFTAMYTDLPGDSMVETLARAIKDSGNGRVLTFHAQVNGESENSVKKFHKRCKALQGLFPDRKVTTRWMDATTSMSDRARFLRELDETPNDEVYVIHSCETISEGVDTKCCNHVFFCDAAMSYRIAIQKIGRCVRLREQRHPATITIPACIPREEYAALGTVEERNAYIREQYSDLGKFSQLFDFIACLRENDQELLDLVLQSHKAPGRKEHYERELEEGEKKEKPRFTLEQAVQRITGQPFSGDLAADADTAGRTIEVHSLENGVETYGSGAALETLVEIQPGMYVHTRRRLSPPQNNRMRFTESPFLMSLHAPDGVGIGDGIGGSLRTAVMDYEVRPERTDQIIQTMHDFYAQHGEPNFKGLREHESFLASWIGCRRRDYKKGWMTVERIERITTEFPWWSWAPQLDYHKQTIQLLHLFYAENGRAPAEKKHQCHERTLSIWIGNRRQDKIKSRNAELCLVIDREFPWWSWDPSADNLEETIQLLHAFYSIHQDTPKQRGIRENEKVLNNWITSRRADKKNNRNGALCDRVEREFTWWTWNPYASIFEINIQLMHAFYNEHGEPAYGGVRENEKVLYSWMHNLRVNKKKGKTHDQCARVEQEFTWWCWDPVADGHDRIIKLLHAFYKEYGAPKQHGIRDNENVLATWINERRTNKKKGQQVDLCDRIDREFSWWTWDHHVDTCEKQIQLLHAFYTKHGVAPTQLGDRDHEHSLAVWIGNRRQDKKKGRNIELCNRIEREFTWWKWVGPNSDKQRTSANVYESMTVPKLKDVLRERGLAAGGRTKAVLIERLRHNDGESNLLPEGSAQADQVAASGMTKFNIPMIFQH